jgi:acyl-CoA synthetase (AMP-forming)/AMP-acid ligase II
MGKAVPKSWPRGNVEKEIWEGMEQYIYKERPKSLIDLFYRTVEKYPHKEGFICGEDRLTFRDMADSANKLAWVFQRDFGIHKGDRIALLLWNCLEFVVAYFACAQIGAISVPLNARLRSRELHYQINDSEPSLLVVGADLWKEIVPIQNEIPSVRKIISCGEKIEGLLYFPDLLGGKSAGRVTVDINEGDLCSIIYTSGTTGFPKGVMVTHRNIVNTAMVCSEVLDTSSEDSQLIAVPFFHVTGLHSQLDHFVYMGGKSVIMKTFKVDEAMAIIEKESITSVVAVPTIYWLMLVSPSFKKYNLTSLRTICYGGAAASPELIVQLSKEFPKAKLINAGGLTEGTSGQYALPAEDGLRKAGAVGLPMPCTELRVVGEHGEDLPPGQVGEMILKGPGICKGYWKKPEATAKSFKDGWLYTGDLAKIDEEGYVWLVDRKTDMIIRGGENIYSIEVENILYFHPKVLEAAVVGVPDKIFGEEVKAFLYLKEGESADEEEIRDHCRKYLADYKVPKYIEFLKEPLPRNPGGKVIKAALRK